MLATINYVTAPEDGLVKFTLDTHWSGLILNPQAMPIEDARLLSSPATLAREGFTLTRIVSGVTDYQDEEQIRQRWMPAVAEQVKAVTGAQWVVTFAHNVRYSNNNPLSGSTPVAAPARAAHADLAPAFDLSKLEQEPLAEDAAKEMRRRLGNNLPKRWAVFNIWQQISPPPQDTPLAVCDLSSVQANDILNSAGSDGSPNSRVYALSFFRHNPAHRWYYFANMLPGEAIIFSGFDPAHPLLGRTPHNAFDLPNPAPFSVPRNSIEIRAVAIFEE